MKTPSNPSLERTRGSVVRVRLTPSLACAGARAAQLRRYAAPDAGWHSSRDRRHRSGAIIRRGLGAIPAVGVSCSQLGALAPARFEYQAM